MGGLINLQTLAVIREQSALSNGACLESANAQDTFPAMNGFDLRHAEQRWLFISIFASSCKRSTDRPMNSRS